MSEKIVVPALGENITEFYYHNKKYTPQQFAEAYSIQPEDYINITSFSHEPFYSNFILNIPDNFSNGSFFNLPIEELIHTIDSALKEGYTIAIDCDVSEKTFSSKNGIAVELIIIAIRSSICIQGNDCFPVPINGNIPNFMGSFFRVVLVGENI